MDFGAILLSIALLTFVIVLFTIINSIKKRQKNLDIRITNAFLLADSLSKQFSGYYQERNETRKILWYLQWPSQWKVGETFIHSIARHFPTPAVWEIIEVTKKPDKDGFGYNYTLLHIDECNKKITVSVSNEYFNTNYTPYKPIVQNNKIKKNETVC
jgi:hypothetical protein